MPQTWWEVIVFGLVTIITAFFMEGVAWFTHKFVMHGFLWVLHEDHHRPRKGVFEKNDLFAVFFAVPSAVSVFFGLAYNLYLLTALGLGMTLYGIGYVVFHDMIFHKRIRVPTPRFAYMQRIINAHRYHHSSGSRKEDNHAFGFLWAPAKYREWPPRGMPPPRPKQDRQGA